MQAQEQKPSQSITISADDLDAALRLLEEEEQSAHTDGRLVSPAGIVSNLLMYTIMVAGFSALASGLAVIVLHLWWGLWLLAAGAGLAFVWLLLLIFYVVFMPDKDVSDSIKKVRNEIGEGEFAKVSDALFRKRTSDHDPFTSWGGLMLLPWIAALISLPFAAWFGSNTLLLISLAVQGLVSLIIGLLITAGEYKELKYLKRVSKLRAQFGARLRAEGDGPGGVAVSPGEMELLGNAETKRAVREAAKVLEESGAEAASLYSVTYTPEALRALNHEHDLERRQRIREAVDALQFDPRPAAAVAGDGEGRFVIEVEDYLVRYEVDDEKERLVVTAVGAREVTNAS